MKKKELGLIIGIFVILVGVYLPITVFVFEGLFNTLMGIAVFSVTLVFAALVTLVIYYLISSNNRIEEDEDEEEDEEDLTEKKDTEKNQK
jgi:phosphotransferase system  glucose/maltose/N-acetylglucosamine-specific IIC component